MCGRFALTTPPDVIARWYELMQRLEYQPRYNIAPTQQVLAIRHDEKQQREAVNLRWGLIPFWAKDASIGNRLINARSESAADKPSFRAAMKKRRCLIPASGFYEWKKIGNAKQPYYISRDDENPITFAGLWESWTDPDTSEPVQSCTILTTDANKPLRELHDRMPVVLPRDAWEQWLDVQQYEPDALSNLLRAAPDTGWTFTPVSRRVNSPANDDPSVLEPVDQSQQPGPKRTTRSTPTSQQKDDSAGSLFE